MPSPLQEAAVEAIELDAFAKDIPDLIFKGDTLYSFFKNNATTIPVSNVTAAGGVTRPSFRVPMRLQAGSPINQGTGNGDSLGRGSGSKWDAFALSPVFVYAVNEITFLSQIATDGRKRGLFNVQAQELKNSFDAATQGIEGLINSDGSGAIDQIPSTATVSSNSGSGAQTSFISGLNVAASFTDQQVIQVFPSIGGATRGTATISFVDPVSNTLYFSTVLPSTGGATAVGDYLMVNGAAGSAGSSILGLRSWQVNSNTGTLAGLNRASYPGRLSTPTINLSGGAITNSVGQRAMVLMGRALGPDADSIKNAVWYTGPDQGLAISNLYYNVLIANAQQVKGDESLDMGKKFFAPTFCGRDVHYSWTAQPGRLDLFTPDTWYVGEMLPLELYDFGGGMTVVPVPDIVNGGYLTSHQMAYVAAFNLANSNVRAGCYVQNAAQPTI